MYGGERRTLMRDDPTSITRRAILKNAAIGSTSVIGVQQGSEEGRAATLERTVKRVSDERTIGALISTVKTSIAYDTYEDYFEHREQFELQSDDPTVYEVPSRGENVTYGVTFDLVNRQRNRKRKRKRKTIVSGVDTTDVDERSRAIDEQHSRSDLTFYLENSSIERSVAFVFERLDPDTTTGTKVWIENGALRQESLTMTRSEGSVEIAGQTRSGVSTQSMFGIGCRDCTEILKSICIVGCSAPSSLICTIAPRGVGGIACGVAADLICNQTMLSEDCSGETHKQWQRCRDAGFC